MPLIVDTYNLLSATMPPELAGLDQAGLCRLLARSRWARRDRADITLVCDGRGHVLGLLESPVPEVELIYSGTIQIADDVIIELIDACSAPKRLTVVSSDREIQQAARRRRARVIRSEDFIPHLLGMLHHAPAPPAAGKPQGQVPPEDVDLWLEAFGVNADRLDPDEEDRPWWRPRMR